MVTARYLGKKKHFKGKHPAQYDGPYEGDMYFYVVERTEDGRLKVGEEIRIDVTDVSQMPCTCS